MRARYRIMRSFVRIFMQIFLHIFLYVSRRFRFMRGRFMLIESRRIDRRRFNIIRVRVRSRCRNIRRPSLSELRERFPRQKC